jgi:hypothetical protein
MLTNDPPAMQKVLLAYDIRTTFPFDREVSNPKYNSTYYFLVQNYTLPLKTYPNDEFNVTVQSADQSLIPYVKDPEYCVQDSDCTLRTNFCTYGGFNNYHSLQTRDEVR